MNLSPSASAMKKLYQVKVIPSAGEVQTRDIAASSISGPTALNANPGDRYQLFDKASGLAPDNIRVSRKGKNLRIYFDGSEQADLVINDYYATSAVDAQALVGQLPNGNYHPYIPESAESTSTVAQLTDTATPIGMALGSEPIAAIDFAPATAGALAAAAGVNPLWAAPLLLLGAGGGGSKASPDTTPPALKSAQLSGADDTGLSATDNITSNNKPRITGETEPNATVKVTLNGHVYTGQADAQGHYAIAVTDPLPDGLQTYKVEACDAAGNKTTIDGTPFTVDATAPAAPTGALYGADDTGLNTTDNITSNNKPRIAGNAEPNATVKISINGHDYSAIADAQGHFLIPIADALPDKGYTYKVQATDSAGNSTTVDGTPFTVDTAAPPTNALLASLDDTGWSATDGITGLSTPRIAGDTDPKAAVKITINGKVYSGTADAQGHFLIPITDALPDKIHTYKVQATDSAGNTTTVDGTPFTVDTLAQQGPGTLADPNAGFTVSITQLRPDTGKNTVQNQTDFLTNSGSLSFTGSLASSLTTDNFNPNTGRVLAEVIDSSGHIVALQYLTPTQSQWTFDNTAVSLGVAGAVSTYTLKTVTVDNAGHFMNASTHAFTVDLQAPAISQSGGVNAQQFTTLNFQANEQGSWFFNATALPGNSVTTLSTQSSHYEVGTFPLVFRDAAGNETAFKNTLAWDLAPSAQINLSASTLTSPAFDSGQLVGSVGKYVMATNQSLDMASLYTLTPVVQGNGGINHVVMGSGTQTLTVSIGDVLELGISNSFLSSANFIDHLQMRVDGDSANQLNLTKQWANSTSESWGTSLGTVNLDGKVYNVYNNEALKLDVFVQSTIHVNVL